MSRPSAALDTEAVRRRLQGARDFSKPFGGRWPLRPSPSGIEEDERKSGSNDSGNVGSFSMARDGRANSGYAGSRADERAKRAESNVRTRAMLDEARRRDQIRSLREYYRRMGRMKERALRYPRLRAPHWYMPPYMHYSARQAKWVKLREPRSNEIIQTFKWSPGQVQTAYSMIAAAPFIALSAGTGTSLCDAVLPLLETLETAASYSLSESFGASAVALAVAAPLQIHDLAPAMPASSSGGFSTGLPAQWLSPTLRLTSVLVKALRFMAK